ncbi:homoserine dehydrogenase [Candidatus Omnitrophota bacterium]
MVKRTIGIIGLGTVGAAFLTQMKREASFIRTNVEIDIKIGMVCDLDPKARRLAKKCKVPYTRDANKLINDPRIDIVVELIGGLYPAKEFIISALKNGKDVVTANKALLAHSGREIFSLAYRLGRSVKFEAAVAGGIPLIKNVSEVLRFGRIRNIYGILNGTTNFILSQMSKDQISFSKALTEAKEKGFAERDPSLDIKGIDSFHKISVLSFLCFGAFPKMEEVIVDGIGRIDVSDILYAKEMGLSIKLLAIAKRQGAKIDLRVHPALIPEDHPLAKTSSVSNAVFINTESAGNFFFSGPGAGGKSTSLSVLSDVLSLCNQKKAWVLKAARLKGLFRSKGELDSRYYLRFSALDRPGVLAKVSRILSDLGISIASVGQKERGEPASRSKFVPIVMLTHKAKESSISKAMQRIDRLSIIKAPTQIIRIENL